MAVSRALKEERLAELTTELSGADNVIVVDFKGLDVPQVTELRRQVRAGPGSVSRGQEPSRDAGHPRDRVRASRSPFQGDDGHRYGSEDPVVLAKTLVDFAKDAPVLTVKGGVFKGSRSRRRRSRSWPRSRARPSSTPSS